MKSRWGRSRISMRAGAECDKCSENQAKKWEDAAVMGKGGRGVEPVMIGMSSAHGSFLSLLRKRVCGRVYQGG